MNNQENLLIDIKDYKIIREIDKGSYGTVYCIQNVKTNQKFAAKIIKSVDDKNIDREIKIINQLQHPTIIKFQGYSLKDFNDNDNVTLIMELAEKGSLKDLLDNARRGRLEEIIDNTIKQKILIGISRGMMYLHKNHAIHRDLKPGNILLDNNFEPHIADFGSSKLISDKSIQSQTQSVGTYLYMAPEAIATTHYDEKVDVYSFGIIMYEIITGNLPYENFQRETKMTTYNFLEKVVKKNYRPKFKVPIKESFKQLIIECWSKNPKDRPSFEEIYNKLTSNDCDSDDEEPTYFLEDVDEDEISSYIEKIEIDSNQNDEFNQDDINQLKQKFEDEINKMKKEHQDEINKLKKDKKDEIDQLVNDHQDEINKLKDEIIQLKENHQDEINKLKIKKNDEISQLVNDHQDEIIQLKKNHQDEINLLKKEHRKKIIQLEENHQDEVNEMKNEISNHLKTIKNLQIQLNDVKKKKEIETKKPIINVPYSKGNEFNGIINYLKSKFNIYNEINITSSSVYQNDQEFAPFNVIKYDDLDAEFHTNDLENSWICFEFKNHYIIPKNYTIRSFALDRNASHLRSWVVEFLNKKNEWEIIDCQNNCVYLNGRNFTYTFSINNPKNQECKFVRIRQTSENWRDRDFLKINSIEFYGFIH